MTNEHEALVTRLRTGEYDGGDIMAAWLAIESLSRKLEAAPQPDTVASVGDESTYEERFRHALTILCGGTPPPEPLCNLWLTTDDVGLQDWVKYNASMEWVQGIAVIEAARTLAEQPEEGEGHQPYQPDTVAMEIAKAWRECRRDFDACQKVIHVHGGFDPAYVTDAIASLKRMDDAVDSALLDQEKSDV